MADKIPDFALSPREAAAWTRWAQDEIVDLRRDKGRRELDQNAADKGLGASVASLSDQVRDLRGRVSYVETSPGTSGSWSTTQAANTAWGPLLSFTLTESRVVSLSFIVAGTANIVSFTAAGGGYSNITPALFLNDSLVGVNQAGISVVIGAGTGSPAYKSAETSSSLQARALITLPAGTHTLQGGFRFRQVVVTTGSGVSGFVTASDPQVFVDVLQPAGA